MKLGLERLFSTLGGIILGSMLTMLFLRERVDPSLAADFNQWSSILLFSLIALLLGEWVVSKMMKRSNG